jgi:drug/metabolite transporter (DMT)-like permease
MLKKEILMTKSTEIPLESTDSSRQLQSKAVLGVILMIAGLSLYPLSDAFVKHLMGTYSVHQATFLRAVARLIPLVIATFFQGGPLKVLRTQHPWLHTFRLSINVTYTLAFMYAVSLGSLTVIYTLGYTSPLFMIILSALFLKERITMDRWLAVILGMVGVAVAMNPGTNLFEWVSVVVLCGTFLGALNKILMRQLAKTEHSLAIAIYPNIVMICATLPLLLNGWHPMPLNHWLLFGFVGAITALGQYAIAQALRFAPASTLAPIDYSTFFWVVSLDFLWWERTPSISTFLGACIIVGSNLFVLQRTRKEESQKTLATENT